MHKEDWDRFTNPDHYTSGRTYEPMLVIEDWGLSYLLGQVVRYVARAGRKGPELDDLLKARQYLNRRIAVLRGETKEDTSGTI